MFFPSEEEPGWYFLINRQYSSSFFRPVTYLSSVDKPGSGFLVAMADKKDQGPTLDRPIFKEHRQSYLWKPVRTDDGYYMIYNKDRGATGCLSYAAKEHSEYGKIVQLVNVNGDNPDFIKSYPDDVKWEFIPGAINLKADISNFEYEIPPMSVIESMATKGNDRSLVFAKNIENRGAGEITATIKKEFSIADKFGWGFNEEIKASVRTKVKAGIPWIVDGEVETGFEFAFGSHQEWETVKTSTLGFEETVKVPPNSAVSVSGYVEMLKDVSFPFKAHMILRGTTLGRISRDGGGELTNGQLDGDGLMAELKSRGISYTIVAKNENSAICQLSGNFKGSFAFRVVMESHDILKQGSMAANMISKRSQRFGAGKGLEAKAKFCQRIK